jgi:hypothetical protein
VHRTPIAAVAYARRAATGHDDLVLVESELGLRAACTLVERRVTRADGAPLDVRALPVGDLDSLVVELRREALGDRLIAEGSCPSCGAPVDVDFSLAEFREHRRPRSTRHATPAEEPGWFRLSADPDVSFRLPTVGDLLETTDLDELTARCVRGRRTRRVERAMEALGPALRADVQGSCPECDAAVPLDVDARELCLEELRFVASAVVEEVHLLASVYHWREEEILELPSARRTRYAEHVRAGRGAALSAEAFGA